MDFLGGGVVGLRRERLEHEHALPRRPEAGLGQPAGEVVSTLLRSRHGPYHTPLMRLILILTPVAGAFLLVLGALAGCGEDGSAPESARVDVAAGFYPLAFAAEEIGGDRVAVTNLTPAGSEPHDLEVSPGDVGALREADLVILLGRGFQPQLEDAARDGDNVLHLLDTEGLTLLPDDDPHVWLDPVRYATIARRIAAALEAPAAADPFVRELEALDGDFRRGLADCERRELVTSHEAFGYLADRYGLHEVGVTGLSPEAEADPGRLQEVVDRVRESGATTVFVEPLASSRLAETVAREAGAATAVLDPLEGLTEEQAAEGDDYFSVMRRNLGALRAALECS
jgi:zinc transport system substrate-binding protein